jgi:glycosyltransferase involved in cell wall biosynthesis
VKLPRILHLLANFKWTGPAAPAIRTAVHLRRVGADVVFAQAAWKPPAGEHRMARELWGCRMPVTGDLELRKHFRPLSVVGDARRLRRRLDRGDFDLLHSHLPGDHLVAALACAGVRPRPLVVRTLYDSQAPGRSLRSVLAFRHTDGVVVPSRRVAEQMRQRYGFGAGRVLYQDPPVDSQPARTGGGLRERWGLSPEQPVIGISARIQPHRRFDLLWDVARRVVDREPTARFVLLGRGGERDVHRLVREPIRRLGLGDHVVLPGYLSEPEYSLAVRSFDLFLFLVPGSDGTCRAVREAMAAGLPVVATRRGILPELLQPDPTVPGAEPAGISCHEDSEELAGAILALLRDDDRRHGLSRGALLRARHSMDPVAAARRLMEFYDRLRAEVG